MPANERSKNRKSAVTWTGPKQGGFAMNANQPNNTEEPLSSWKEIGAYLQRNEATARRWEKEEGLPIHRHSHKRRSSVYAYPSEIDTWRAGRKVAAEPAP